jgi:hypothetical protein
MNKSECIILKMLGVLLAVMLQTPFAWAGDPVNETGETALNDEFLTVAANTILEEIPGSSAFMDTLDSGSKADKKGFYAGIENSVERISAYFFRYFSVNDRSAEIQGSLPRLKNRTRSFAEDLRDFELNLCFDIGYRSADDLNLDQQASFGRHETGNPDGFIYEFGGRALYHDPLDRSIKAPLN